MTEMPSPYDLIQDGRIEGIEEIVTPHYQPPGDQEYSFPIVGQGVSSEMFQQISRAAGTGVYVQHDAEGAQSPYRLTGMPGGDAETNSTNQMMLRTSNVTGRSEAAIEGFFHTQLQDMPVSFPPVTTPTTYYLALTYDPRREEEEAGPIRIEVHANDLPTTHGRKHIVLWTVRREPNQLLTQATIQQTNPWLGHVINVWSYDHLPEPTSIEYGTLAVAINYGTKPALYTNRGIHGWFSVDESEPQSVLNLRDTWEHYPGFRPLRVRRVSGGVLLSGMIRPKQPVTMSNGLEVFHVPPLFRPKYATNVEAIANLNSANTRFRISSNGVVTKFDDMGVNVGWLEFNNFYPID